MKKILAILSSVMIISACAVSPIYADETVTEPTANEQIEEKITDPEEICSLINNFIDECKIPSVRVSVCQPNEEKPFEYVYMPMSGSTSYIKNLINNFIEEKNIDKMCIDSFSNTLLIEDYWFCDINGDGKADVRDCSYIASSLAKGEKLNYKADYNSDGKSDIRDAVVLAASLARSYMKF